MSRTLKYDIPGVDWRRSLADAYEFGVHSLFEPEYSSPFPLVVEIGFGRGEFLLEMAAKHPELAFVGVEVSWKRVLKMARKVAVYGDGLASKRIAEVLIDGRMSTPPFEPESGS